MSKMLKGFILAVLFLALASLAPFFFPWQFALLSAIISALIFPPAAIVSGLLLDILYYGGSGLPYFTIIGILIALAAFFVQGFIKARIMS